jgi:hypothetical protein
MSFKILTTSECDVAQVFSAPSSAGASVTIDGTPLVPSPFLNLTLEKYTSGDTITGGLLRVQLSGTVVGASFDEVASIGNGSAQSIKEVLELAANSDCITLEIKCGEEFIKGRGKIVSFSASEGNQPSWVNYAPYTVDIELYENLLNNKQYVESEIFGSDPNLSNLLIKDLSEEFTVDINENSFIWDTVPGAGNDLEGVGDKHVKVSFSIGAVGLGASCPSSGTLKGLEAVEEYMILRLSKLKNMDINGLNNGPDDEIVPALNDYRGESFLDFRSININPIENRMSISGEIIYRPSGCSHSNVFSSLTVEENLTTDGNNITISGNITGLVDSQYDTIIRNTTYFDNVCNFNEKMANANAFFGIIKEELENIAKAHASSAQGNESLFPEGKDYIKDEDNVCPPPTGAGDVCYLTETPMPEPEFCDLRLVSSQISRNYSRGEINFTYTYNNNPNCSIPGARTIEIEATHDMPRDNIVEIVVPGRGEKGVLTQNLCVLSSEKWSFSFNATLITNSCGRPKERMELTKLRDCAKDQLEEFKDDNGIDTNCWFITDKQEALGNKTYRYNIQYTKPSCP